LIRRNRQPRRPGHPALSNLFSDTVPEEMDLCLTCRKPTCSSAEYRNCQPRMARAAELAAEGQAASAASASLTTVSSAPGSKGETSPADLTSA
jgi:hypothetical protein